MKLDYQSILDENSSCLNKKIYLLFGDEVGLISNLSKIIYSKNKDNSEIIYWDSKKDKTDLKDLLLEKSLFSKNNFIIIKNPKEELLKTISEAELFDSKIVIQGVGIKANSKLKIYFDNHSDYASIACYSLDSKKVKILINSFLNNHNIKMSNDSYWYLLENITYDFLSIQNELDKLLSLKERGVTIGDLKKLLFNGALINSENYFFYAVEKKSLNMFKEIISHNISTTESYEILNSIKKFLGILSKTFLDLEKNSMDESISKNFPRYLFMKKAIFKQTLKKCDMVKINKTYNIVGRAESLLRTNSSQHKEILERMLLNIGRVLS